MQQPKEPWFITLENQLSAAILVIVALIAFDLFNVNPIHFSGKMMRLSMETIQLWSADYDD